MWGRKEGRETYLLPFLPWAIRAARAGKATGQNRTVLGLHYAFTSIHMLRNFNPCFAVNYFSLLMYTAPSHSHLQP